MLIHILGYSTMTAQIGLGLGLIPMMWRAGREHRTWIRPLTVPKASEVPLTLSSGTDYVGLI